MPFRSSVEWLGRCAEERTNLRAEFMKSRCFLTVRRAYDNRADKSTLLVS